MHYSSDAGCGAGSTTERGGAWGRGGSSTRSGRGGGAGTAASCGAPNETASTPTGAGPSPGAEVGWRGGGFRSRGDGAPVGQGCPRLRPMPVALRLPHQHAAHAGSAGDAAAGTAQVATCAGGSTAGGARGDCWRWRTSSAQRVRVRGWARQELRANKRTSSSHRQLLLPQLPGTTRDAGRMKVGRAPALITAEVC